MTTKNRTKAQRGKAFSDPAPGDRRGGRSIIDTADGETDNGHPSDNIGHNMKKSGKDNSLGPEEQSLHDRERSERERLREFEKAVFAKWEAELELMKDSVRGRDHATIERVDDAFLRASVSWYAVMRNEELCAEEEFEEKRRLWENSAAAEAIIEIIKLDLAERFGSATIREYSIYDEKPTNETVEAFVLRTYETTTGRPLPRYSETGLHVTEFIERTYGKSGYLDGKFFTRATLGRLDREAYVSLNNWLKNNELPADLPLPSKWGQSADLVHDLTPEQQSAAVNQHNRRHRHKKSVAF